MSTLIDEWLQRVGQARAGRRTERRRNLLLLFGALLAFGAWGCFEPAAGLMLFMVGLPVVAVVAGLTTCIVGILRHLQK